MIIAAYAGTGKSTFAARTDGAIDLPCMPCKWILPPADRASAELEGEKGARYRLPDPRYPDNYIAEILRAERDYRFVTIPTDMSVVRRLQEIYGRKVILCYPEDSCKEEYHARFVARGNSESFLELFIDSWDHFMKSVRENERGVHIVMRPGEYLTDLVPRLEDERRADTTQPVAKETIRGIEEKLLDLKKDLVLYLSGYEGSCLYPITDLDAPEERKFLCQIGREILDGDIDIRPVILPGCALRETLAEAYGLADREAVRAFVEGHRDWQGN